VRGFTEALRHELEGSSGLCFCVHREEFARRLRSGKAGTNAPKREKAKAFALAQLQKPRRRMQRRAYFEASERRDPAFFVGFDAHQIDIMQRLRPATYWKALSRRIQEPSHTGGRL